MAEYTVTVQRTVFEELGFEVEAESVEEAVAIARERYATDDYTWRESTDIRDDPDWSAAEGVDVDD